jgi:heme a synthase
MVKSGLDPEIIERKDVPRVSQYRLAAHLSMAFLIYTFLLKNGIAALRPPHLFPLTTIIVLYSKIRNF